MVVVRGSEWRVASQHVAQRYASVECGHDEGGEQHVG
jgi:hypothetical protein